MQRDAARPRRACGLGRRRADRAAVGRIADPAPIDPQLVRALAAQLERRREALARGATHVGWKLGMGDRERLGGHIAVGFLTSETVLGPGGTYSARAAGDLRADAEIAVELGRDLDAAESSAAVAEAIARCGGALEIVDLAPAPGEPESIVAANVFHRAVAFGPLGIVSTSEVAVSVAVNGERRASARSSTDLSTRIAQAARLLAALGERLRAGDRIITGSVVQERVVPGDDVVADFGRLGTVRVAISA